MSANLENSAVATGLERVNFHSNPKDRQRQKCSQYIQVHSSHTLVKWCSKLSKPGFSNMWTVNFRCSGWFSKRQRSQRSNCRHLLDHGKTKRVPEKHLFLLYDYNEAFDCVDHNKLWKTLKEMGIPDHLTCLLRNLYAGQEATVRIGQTGSK